MEDETVKKEDEVYESIEHPAQEEIEEPETIPEIVEDIKEEIHEWTMDRATRIALVTGLLSTIITLLNVLIG